MYLDFYKLKIKPFQITCDPKFIWLGEKHQEALAMLHYGILDNRGFLLLTGEVGTGKTLLINRLMTMIPPTTAVTRLFDPDLQTMDFYRMLADGFKIPPTFRSKAEFLIQMRKFLHAKAAENHQVLLIIDEAHRLGHRLMEDIRTLSNIEFQNRKLIDIFFVGQPELNRMLLSSENRALAQRITLLYHIDPLNRPETADYVRHRLKVAGGKKCIFRKNALKKVFEYSGGLPRLINIICDHALLTGYVSNIKKIDARMINACAAELHISTRHRRVANIRSAAVFRKADIKGDPDTDRHDQANKVPAIPKGFRQKGAQHHSAFSMKTWQYAAIAALMLVIWSSVLINLNHRPESISFEDAITRDRQAPPVETALPWKEPSGDPTIRIGATYALNEIHLKDISAPPVHDKVPAKRAQPPAKKIVPPPRKPAQLPEPLSEPRQPEVKASEKPSKPEPTITASIPVVAKAQPSRPTGNTRGMETFGSDASAKLGWPEREDVHVQFGEENQIASQSMRALALVAVDLMRFPERMVYLYGYPANTGSIRHRRMASRQSVDAVKAYLISKGALAYQLKVVAMDALAQGAAVRWSDAPYAVVEFPRDHHFTDYNPDK